MNGKHRKPGNVGRFTVHSPSDYVPRHRLMFGQEIDEDLMNIPTSTSSTNIPAMPLFDLMECW